MDLQTLLPRLLPDAIAWAEYQAQQGASLGKPLSEALLTVARGVGVRHPDRVRIIDVDRLPAPEEPILKQAAVQAGLLAPDMVGLTLGYSIFLIRGHDDVRLISHECRHVYQYETHGSIGRFLQIYLQQIVEFGYQDAPLEIDARAHEIDMV